MSSNMKKYGIMIIAAVLLAVLAFAGAASADTWQGGVYDMSWYTSKPSAEEYHITNADQFAGLSRLVEYGVTFSGKTIILDTNVNLDDHLWTPIGTSATKIFDGYFNGNGHTISNLNISAKQGSLGLFGRISERAKLTNTTIDGVKITRSGRMDTEIGSLVGYSFGYVENCHVTNLHYLVSETEGDTGIGGIWMGGLIGESKGLVVNCSVRGDPSTTYHIYATSPGTFTPKARDIGGLIGMAYYNVVNCSSDCGVAGKEAIGGLIGRTKSGCTLVKNCHANGTVTGKSQIGGLIGYVDISNNDVITIENCSANVAVVCGEKSYALGGLIGQATTATGSSPTAATIKNCSATGDVTGDYYVGGLIGSTHHCTISNCHATGDVTSVGGATFFSGSSIGGLIGESGYPVSDCYATGDVTGWKNVGGLIGQATFLLKIDTSVVNCYATGNVYGDQGAGDNIGGLIGTTDDNVESCYATGNVYGKTDVGGLIGEANHNGYSYKYVRSCNASGKVHADGECVGGLIGRNFNNIYDCHASGVVFGYDDDVGGLVGRSSASSKISFCDSYATGNVHGYGDYIGGLVGYVDDHLRRCNASGNVYAGSSSSTCSYVGGLAGWASKDLIHCYATGDVVNHNGNKYTGGLVGYVNGRNCDGNICLEYSYATGNVTVEKGNYVGGLAGYANNKVTTSYATGNISASSSKWVGGLTGYNNYEITSCFATGKVEGKEKVGGLSGEADRPISYSAALNPSVSGKSYVGKIVGDRDGEDITGCTIWVGMTKTGSGGYDQGKAFSSSTIWATYPAGMWAHLPGIGTGQWVENDGDLNPNFELPTVGYIARYMSYDLTSSALHLKPTGSYTVTFNVQGHGVTPESQTVTYGEKVEKPTDPVDGDYEFKGWYKESACENAWDFDNDTVRNDMTLYAKWVETEKQVVVFDVQGHGTAPDAQYVKTGSTATRPSPDPSDTLWTFAGWYQDSACTNEWDFETPILHDTTIYAKWKQNTILVAFDVQGHGTAPDTQHLAEDEKVIEPDDPEAEGYIFGGWYTEPACSNKWDFDTKVTADRILYAKWTPQLKVTFDVQGHGIAPDSQYLNAGDLVTQPEDPESDRYEFGGWYKESACSSPWNFDSDTVSADTTLYAKWTKQHLVVFYVQEIGDTPDAQLVTDGEPATEPEEPTDPHYTFNGWYKEANCTNKWNFADPVRNDMILFANWTPLNYTVTFDAQGGSPTPAAQDRAYGDRVTQPAEPTKDNYVFKGWISNITGTNWNFVSDTVLGDMTLTANWTKSESSRYYNVTVKTTGCIAFVSDSHPSQYEPIVVTIATLPGFGGDPDIKSEPTVTITPPYKVELVWLSGFIMPGEDVELNITSKISIPHTVIPTHTGDGVFLTTKLLAYEGDSVYCVVLPGYQSTIKDNIVNLTYNDKTESVKVYGIGSLNGAKFTMPNYEVKAHVDFIKNSFNVTATSDGNGTIIPDKDSGYSGDEVNFYLQPDDGYQIANLTLNDKDVTKDIVYLDDDGTYTCSIVDRDLAAHATFKPLSAQKYNITNETDGNGTLKTDKTKAYGDEVVTSILLANPGYQLKTATYTNETGVEKDQFIYPDEEAYMGKFIMPYNDTTVSGTFEAKTITVTFNVNGGNLSSLNPTSKEVTYGQAYGPLPKPTREVFNFEGWYRNIECTGDEVNETTIVSTPVNHTLYAKWSYAIIISNFKVNFGTYYEGDEVTPITDAVYTTLDTSTNPLYLYFPAGTSFNFTNSSTQVSLDGTYQQIPKDDPGFVFNVTPVANLPAGYYNASVGLYYGQNHERYLGEIPVTYSVLASEVKEDPAAAVPDLPAIYKLAWAQDDFGVAIIGIGGAENLHVSGTSADIYLNDVSEENRTTIHVTNVTQIPGKNAIYLDGVYTITALYPTKVLENGNTYTVEIGMTDVSANLPSLSGAFNESLASIVSSATGVTPFAMVSTLNPDEALDSMNKLIIEDGINISMTVAKSSIPDTAKLGAYHVEGTDVTQIAREITDAGSDYIVTVNGSSFSGYILGLSPDPVPQPSGGGSKHTGGTVILPETVDTSETMCKVNFNMNGHGVQVVNQTVSLGNTADEPYPVPTADGYTFTGWYTDKGLISKYEFSKPVTDEKIELYAGWTANPSPTSTTSKSPAPVFGLIAGIGAAALVLARMRR